MPPPRVWLPSSGLARTPIAPNPTVLLRRRSNGAAVDARDAVCRVDATSNVTVLEPPLEGYKLVLPVEIMAAADTNANASVIVSTTPIVASGILLGGAFATHFNLTVACQRAQGDDTAGLAALENGDDAGRGDLGADLKAQTGQFGGHQRRGAELAIAQLWMFVNVPAPRHDLGLDRVGGGKDGVGRGRRPCGEGRIGGEAERGNGGCGKDSHDLSPENLMTDDGALRLQGQGLARFP